MAILSAPAAPRADGRHSQQAGQSNVRTLTLNPTPEPPSPFPSYHPISENIHHLTFILLMQIKGRRRWRDRILLRSPCVGAHGALYVRRRVPARDRRE